jgi:VIT1/CCC1 family predicted Fe2+/Mn2+ transporter
MAAALEPGVRRIWGSGVSFGLTSGVITTLGLMVGLRSGTGSRLAVIGGILTIAVADAFSDALGMHIAEEGRGQGEARHIWAATLSTFVTKLLVALSFAVPVLVLDLDMAVWVAVGWGMVLLAGLSWVIALANRTSPLLAMAEHVAIAGVVITVAQFLGDWVAATFH